MENNGSLDIDYIDDLFEKMSREAADEMNGTHPPMPEEKKESVDESSPTILPKKRDLIEKLFENYDGDYVAEEIDWGKKKGKEVW